jgi:hypothetical protein
MGVGAAKIDSIMIVLELIVDIEARRHGRGRK